jgi:hypothetical protein
VSRPKGSRNKVQRDASVRLQIHLTAEQIAALASIADKPQAAIRKIIDERTNSDPPT